MTVSCRAHVRGTGRCFVSRRFLDTLDERYKMGKPKMPSTEIKEFAYTLQEWAQQDAKRETFVKWLLSRTVSHEFEGTEGKYIIERTPINDFDIKKAVIHAMADCSANPGMSTKGLVQGGPVWPKAYGNIWPKAYGC